MEDWLRQLLEGNGEILLYGFTLAILVFCGMGVPIPEELTFLASGWACAKIGANVWILCAVGVVGIILGDSIPFLAGRRYGMNLITRPFFARLVSQKSIERTQDFFRKHGSKTVFIARFVAGLRMPAFFMAGTMGVRYRTFACWNLLGALISCPTSIALAYFYGEQVREWIAESHVVLYVVLGLIVAYIVFHIWSHRGHPAVGGAGVAPAPAPERSPAAPATPDEKAVPGVKVQGVEQ